MRRFIPSLATIATGLVTAACAPEDAHLGHADLGLSAATTPIIVTHGLAGWPFDPSLKPFLEEQGYTVFMPKVSPFGPVRDRAEELRDQIDDFLDGIGASEAIIVAHSMGGVDARWLLSPDGLAYDRIPAVVTIASPHRGTAIADTVLGGVPFFLEKRVDRLLKWMNLSPDDAATLGALYDLSRDEMAWFNETVSDAAGVEYYSYSSQQKPIQGLNPLLYVSYYIIKSKEGANDGIASVEGAKWGHYLGDLEADHADHVGGLGLKTKFDFKGLYRDAIASTFEHHNAETYDPTHSDATVESVLPESAHDYWNNLDDGASYQLPGAASVLVTFDPQTRVETGYDLIHVETGTGTPIAASPFTGSELAGQTVTVAGDTVVVRLQTDFSVTDWGYRITAVEAAP